jgi:hypothetical protein
VGLKLYSFFCSTVAFISFKLLVIYSKSKAHFLPGVNTIVVIFKNPTLVGVHYFSSDWGLAGRAG